jgi:hypothetical protein
MITSPSSNVSMYCSMYSAVVGSEKSISGHRLAWAMIPPAASSTAQLMSMISLTMVVLPILTRFWPMSLATASHAYLMTCIVTGSALYLVIAVLPR